MYRCSNRDCNKKISIRGNSWFAYSHLELSHIVKLTYYWVYKCTNEQVQHELRIGSDHTVVNWYNFAREVCRKILEFDSEQIGGEVIFKENEESKLVKRKYNRGRRVDGCWVFGGIEREKKSVFFPSC